MSLSSLTSSRFAGRFRRWIRQGHVRFWLYSRFREGLHWAKWLPHRAKQRLRRFPRRAWDFMYWLPYRLSPALWRGTTYGDMAATGFPPAPLPPRVRRLAKWWHRLLARTGLVHMGTYQPVRQWEAGDLAAVTTELVPAQELALEAPKLFGPLPPGWPAPWPDLREQMHAITAAEWREATVVGKFDAVLVGTHCIVGDLWHPDTEHTFDEVRNYAHVSQDGITYWRNGKHSMSMQRAIVVVGGPTGNWAHWTTEYLPRIALVEGLERYRDWPLVIDQALHPNIVESVRLLAGERELVLLPEGVALQLREAVTVGAPGYTAYEYRYDPYRSAPAMRREHTLFSPAALELVRRKAWQAAAVTPARERLIYITRPRGSMRPFVGGEDVERYFASLGFEMIEASGMSAVEQVRLFASARCIAGQSGAGLTNLVFSPPGCRVLVFAANSPHSIFHYFANMGAAVGHHVYYCYGESIYVAGGHPGHAGFSVDLEDAKRLWAAVAADEPGITS